MSFINKSVNYAQTVLLKTKFLAPLLESYNNNIKQNVDDIDLCLKYHIVPNNNQKYYLYITKKSKIETCKEHYDILYFFPDEKTRTFAQRSKTEIHFVYDFFLEINNTFQEDLLLEGYMYKTDGIFTYLITDILCKSGNVVNVDYELRYSLINEITIDLQLSNLNDHLTIGIHPVFSSDNENMISIFLNNFIFQDTINALENIQMFKKHQCVSNDIIKKEDKKMYVQKGPYADVYKVFDLTTGNEEGILYIKGLKESVKIKQLFQNESDTLTIQCKFNCIFNKWEPIF
jgi:hypothetical protein